MKKLLLLFWLLGTLAACSINISQATPTGSPTTLPSPAGATPAAPDPLIFQRPGSAPAWASLNLTGRIIFTQAQQGVWELDLKTGAAKSVFVPPDTTNAWVNAASASPDGKQIVIAYAPPPKPGEVQFGYTDLYLLPADGAAPPRPFLERTDKRESYFNPEWSVDGQSIYFAHLKRVPVPGSDPVQYNFQYDIERVSYPDKQVTTIAQNAYWPRLSADGQRLVYVLFSPDFFGNSLYIANADGSNAAKIPEGDKFQAIDAPLFSPDGNSILFSAVSGGAVSAHSTDQAGSWLDGLSGVKTASAHNVPSDWWVIPIAGGEAKQITKIFDVGLYGDFAPDGQHMAFISLSGLIVMTPDGQNLTRLMEKGAYGTVDWMP